MESKQPLLGTNAFSIMHSPVRNLDQSLELCSKEQLKDMLCSHNFFEEDLEDKEKAELFQMTKKVILENAVHLFFYEERWFFEEFHALLEKRNETTGICEVEFFDPKKYKDKKEFLDSTLRIVMRFRLLSRGIVFQYIDENEKECLVIPDEVYAEITKHIEARGTDDFGKWYNFKAFTRVVLSVYGVLTPEDFQTLWQILFPDWKLTPEQITEHMKFSSAELNSHKWHEKLGVVSDEYLDEQTAKDILEERNGYSIYIPEKQILELWFDNFSNVKDEYSRNEYDQFEVEHKNPLYIKMAEFLKRVRKKEDDWEIVLYNLMFYIKVGYLPTQTLDLLNDDFKLIQHFSKQDFGIFMATYQLLHNTAHLWVKYGWTSYSLADHPDGIEENSIPHNNDDNLIPFPTNFTGFNKQSVPKVGRNDPCPCGSGKKYKHCHGK